MQVTYDYPGEKSPWKFKGGIIKDVSVDVNGDVDLEKEVIAIRMRD